MRKPRKTPLHKQLGRLVQQPPSRPPARTPQEMLAAAREWQRWYEETRPTKQIAEAREFAEHIWEQNGLPLPNGRGQFERPHGGKWEAASGNTKMRAGHAWTISRARVALDFGFLEGSPAWMAGKALDLFDELSRYDSDKHRDARDLTLIQIGQHIARWEFAGRLSETAPRQGGRRPILSQEEVREELSLPGATHAAVAAALRARGKPVSIKTVSRYAKKLGL